MSFLANSFKFRQLFVRQLLTCSNRAENRRNKKKKKHGYWIREPIKRILRLWVSHRFAIKDSEEEGSYSSGELERVSRNLLRLFFILESFDSTLRCLLYPATSSSSSFSSYLPSKILQRVLESRRRETSKFFLGPGCSTFADHGLSFNLQRGKKSFRGSFRDLSSGGLREEKKKRERKEKKETKMRKKGGTKRYKEGRVVFFFLVVGALEPLDIFITAERSYCLSKPRSSPTIIGTKLFAFLLRLLGIGLAQFPTTRHPAESTRVFSSRIIRQRLLVLYDTFFSSSCSIVVTCEKGIDRITKSRTTRDSVSIDSL